MDANSSVLCEDTDVSDFFHGFDGDYSEFGTPEKTQEGQRMRKKYKQTRPKVNTEWSHDAILKLFTAVEGLPMFWDISCTQYKLPKTPARQEIADFLGERSADECKAKWSNLRVSYKTNLSNMKSQKAGSGSGGPIVWKYFNAMNFLVLNETSESISAMTMQPAEALNTPEKQNQPPPQSRCTQIPPLSLSQLSPSDNFKEMAAKAMCAIAKTSELKDQFDDFGAYVASELRSLSPQKRLLAKRKLVRALINIIDEVENS